MPKDIILKALFGGLYFFSNVYVILEHRINKWTQS